MADTAADVKGWARRDEDREIRKGAGPTGARGGEGSRGGHIVGHTRTNKPIYESKGHTSAKGLVTHVEEKHVGLNSMEHAEAAGVHRDFAKQAGKGTPEHAYHEAHARAHELVGANKALAEHFGGSVAGGLAHGMDHSAGGLATDYGRQRTAIGVTPPEHQVQNAATPGLAHKASAAIAAKGGASGTPEEHMNAAGLHGAAANLARSEGNPHQAERHQIVAEGHAAAAKGDHPTAARAFQKAGNMSEVGEYAELGKQHGEKATGAAIPGGASHPGEGGAKAAPTGHPVDIARHASSKAMSEPTRENHVAAAEAHKAAADLRKGQGDPVKAREHMQMAAHHQKEAISKGGPMPPEPPRADGRDAQQAKESAGRAEHPMAAIRRKLDKSPPGKVPGQTVDRIPAGRGSTLDVDRMAKSEPERQANNAAGVAKMGTEAAAKHGKDAMTGTQHGVAATAHDQAAYRHGEAAKAQPPGAEGSHKRDIHEGMAKAHSLAAHAHRLSAVAAPSHSTNVDFNRGKAQRMASHAHNAAASAFDKAGNLGLAKQHKEHADKALSTGLAPKTQRDVAGDNAEAPHATNRTQIKKRL